jgi:hypothetical protein
MSWTQNGQHYIVPQQRQDKSINAHEVQGFLRDANETMDMVNPTAQTDLNYEYGHDLTNVKSSWLISS